jgi:hypothetical protein
MHRDGDTPKVQINRLVLVQNTLEVLISLICGAQA